MILNEQETLASLEKEEKIAIKIPADKNNPNYKTERLFINGVTYQVPVGERCEVPETIYKMLETKNLI